MIDTATRCSHCAREHPNLVVVRELVFDSYSHSETICLACRLEECLTLVEYETAIPAFAHRFPDEADYLLKTFSEMANKIWRSVDDEVAI